MNRIVQRVLDTKQKQGFSAYEADFPELRAEWWSTRAHRGPADFFPTEWREFVGSIAVFEMVRDRATLLGIVDAINLFRQALYSPRLGSLGKADKAKWLVKRATGTLGAHDNFMKALQSLETMIKGTPQYKATAAGRGWEIDGVEVPALYRDF